MLAPDEPSVICIVSTQAVKVAGDPELVLRNPLRLLELICLGRTTRKKMMMIKSSDLHHGSAMMMIEHQNISMV